MNVLRRTAQTVSSVASVATGAVSSVTTGTSNVVSGTVGIIRRASLYGSDSRVKVNECDDEELLRSAKDRVTLTIKCTPGKDAAITSAVALKRMFLLKKNEQGVYNKKLVCTVPHMFLYYFDSELSELPRGVIDLYYYTDMSVEGDGNILKLSAPEETNLKSYYFKIDDPTMLSEFINSLHRDRYNVVRDERDAYQALQDQFSGEMETSSKQLVSTNQEIETLKRDLEEARKRGDEACEVVQNALLKFQVSEEETKPLTTVTEIGELLVSKIDDLNRRLQITVDEYDQQLMSERQLYADQMQELEARLAAELSTKKQADAMFAIEKKDLEFKIREALAEIEKLNLNFQAAVSARDSSEEKANTFNEQKKVLIKEVKTLRKKMETTQQDFDSIKAMNETLATTSEALQRNNNDLSNKLLSAMAALKDAQAQLEIIQDANNAAEQAEELAAKAAAQAKAVVLECNTVMADNATLVSANVASLRFDGSASTAEISESGSASKRNSINTGDAGDDGELSWLSPEQRQHLMAPAGSPAPSSAPSHSDPVRRPSAFAGLFTSYDKLLAKPILRLNEDEAINNTAGDSAANSSSAGIETGQSSSSHATYTASHAIMQQMEGKIICLRCHGTVEGPKYSTCKCEMPAINTDMLNADRDSLGAAQHNSGVAKMGVSTVGTSLFGMLRKASGVVGTAAATAGRSLATTASSAGHVMASHPTNPAASHATSPSHTPVKAHSLLDEQDMLSSPVHSPILASSSNPDLNSTIASDFVANDQHEPSFDQIYPENQTV